MTYIPGKSALIIPFTIISSALIHIIWGPRQPVKTGLDTKRAHRYKRAFMSLWVIESGEIASRAGAHPLHAGGPVHSPAVS